tara:strand:- start:264 stop:1061 length:798 start_codon:yes stop_codon:yes gene_type:complete
MAKYISVPVQMNASSTATNTAAVDSGTTSAATSDKLTEAGQNFLTTVTVGDYAVITTGIAGFPIRNYAVITAVDSNTVLTLGVGNGTTAGVGGLAASGTTYDIIPASDINLCVLAGGTFNSNVRAGDMVCNTTTNLNYRVTNVSADGTTLTLDTKGAIVNSDGFFLLSERSEAGNQKVMLDKVVELRGNVADGEVTFHYKKGAAGNDKLVIAMGDAVTDDAYFIDFYKICQDAWESKWRDVCLQMPIVPSSGTQMVQWAASFSFS